ncbi:MAG: tRNA (adenosine(37)-N6)-threonylcarbamoyltransferase complex transferase subunit TsaD [Candidatus Paceibacterota bacterium]
MKTTILSIETSCDETAVAVLECNGGIKSPTFQLKGNALYSQAEKHAEFGGVYPSLAKREHSQNLIPLLSKALKEAGLETKGSTTYNIDEISGILEREEALLKALNTYIPSISRPDIDAIAVTVGPGLEPALWVGINFARALSTIWDIPRVAVNHLEGHMVSVLAEERNSLQFPALGFVVSGGHTELVCIEKWFEYETIGRTRDDAVGEAFDKVARMLDLPYPGGPEISKWAQEARENSIDSPIELPRPMITSNDHDFSFSGLKTAVLYALRDNEFSHEEKKGIAREFEEAVTDVITKKISGAVEEYNPKSVIAAGGVMANTYIRTRLEETLASHNIPLLLPPQKLATDNAVMIGMAGYLRYTSKEYITTDFSARGTWSL